MENIINTLNKSNAWKIQLKKAINVNFERRASNAFKEFKRIKHYL